MAGNFFSGLVDRLFSRDAQDDDGLPPPEAGTDAYLSALAAALPDALQWQWDDHNQGALAIFEIDAAEHIGAVLDAQFAGSWDRSSIGKAPGLIRNASANFGGLQPKQRIYASGLADDIVLLGLWWPWGHGATVSIRLVPFGPQAQATDVALMRDKVDKAFNIT